MAGPSVPAGADPAPFAFDGLAEDFDRRAGLPAGAVGPIAAALLELAGPGPGLLLDLCAGTGEIGLALAKAAPGDYLGMDLAQPMVGLARARFAQAGVAGALVRGDANQAWPVGGGSARLVFLSRAAHLLSIPHLADEALRVRQRAGAVLVLGRVRRGEDSLRDALRREMRCLLNKNGIQGRRGEEGPRRVAEALAERGGVALPPCTAARWTVRESPAAALEAWREKPGLAGVALPDDLKHRILDQLEAHALERYGGLGAEATAEYRYELSAVVLPPLA